MLNRSRLVTKRALAKSRSVAALDTKSDSFAFGLMQGEINATHMFPFPGIERLDEEQRENLEMMVDPTDSFFTESVDPLHNDQIADVPEDVMQMMKDLGLFGLQVPEELEGIGLNNTQYARMTEVIFETIDLSFTPYLDRWQTRSWHWHRHWRAPVDRFQGDFDSWQRRAKGQVLTRCGDRAQDGGVCPDRTGQRVWCGFGEDARGP